MRITDLIDTAAAPRLPRLAGRDKPAPEMSTVLTASLAAAWAMAVGVLAVVALVLVGWLVDGRSGAGTAEAAQIALQAFLLAHGASLTVDWEFSASSRWASPPCPPGCWCEPARRSLVVAV